ncbi:hypothetical protein [Anaerotignum propionicum]|uniref:hypothetical protein n=1 Tax=Anaerotignum propionicum TaxID=28446 RepID=UPI0028A0BA39|nr:hypothetical protein [Anaerotignum propionicum]
MALVTRYLKRKNVPNGLRMSKEVNGDISNQVGTAPMICEYDGLGMEEVKASIGNGKGT